MHPGDHALLQLQQRGCARGAPGSPARSAAVEVFFDLLALEGADRRRCRDWMQSGVVPLPPSTIMDSSWSGIEEAREVPLGLVEEPVDLGAEPPGQLSIRYLRCCRP